MKRSAKQKLAAARRVLEGESPEQVLGAQEQPRPRQPGESYVEEPSLPGDAKQPADDDHHARFPGWWRALRGC